MKKRSWKLYLSPNPRLVRKCNNSANNLYYLPCLNYLTTLKFITNDILRLCPFSRWWWSGASWSVQCGWIDLANVIYVMVALTLLLLCLPLFLKLRRGFSFIYHFIYPYHYLILSHYIISSWSAKTVKSQTIGTYATRSFVLVDFYCFFYVSLSFLRDSKFSREFYGKMFLRSKSHYLKFRGELIFHEELTFYYRSNRVNLFSKNRTNLLLRSRKDKEVTSIFET